MFFYAFCVGHKLMLNFLVGHGLLTGASIRESQQRYRLLYLLDRATNGYSETIVLGRRFSKIRLYNLRSYSFLIS